MTGRTDTPQDRFCLVGIFFFILGLGTLLPWNFFMTASLYFQSRLNNTETNGTVVRKEYHFNNWMTFLSQLVFTLLNSIMYQRISEAIRIAGSLIFILLLFILTAVLVKVDMDADLFFSVTMATIWFINSFGAILQGSLFGLVGLLPQKYSAIFMSGQGLAGTFAAIAMLLAKANLGDGILRDVCIYCHSVSILQRHCRRQNGIPTWKMGSRRRSSLENLPPYIHRVGDPEIGAHEKNFGNH